MEANNIAQNNMRSPSYISTDMEELTANPAPEFNKQLLLGNNDYQEKANAKPLSEFKTTKHEITEQKKEFHSDRLLFSELGESQEDIQLIMEMSSEYLSGISKWTPLRLRPEVPDEIIKHIIELKRLTGSPYSKLLTITEKGTNKKIGIISTEDLDQEGLAEVSIHILNNYTKRGFATEALRSIIENVGSIEKEKIPNFNYANQKARVQESIVCFSRKLLKPADAEEVKDFIYSGKAIDKTSSKLFDTLPEYAKELVKKSLRSLEIHSSSIEFKGFTATPVNLHSELMLRKCGFSKSSLHSEDYKKYCHH